MLHVPSLHLADHVLGVHLGVLGGARQRAAVVPHPAAPRLVAYRRGIAHACALGVKTFWARFPCHSSE